MEFQSLWHFVYNIHHDKILFARENHVLFLLNLYLKAFALEFFACILILVYYYYYKMPTLVRHQSSRMSTKSEEPMVDQVEMCSTIFNKSPVRRYIARIPGKEELRGKNPQMKMIGPEVEDALQRKNYVSLITTDCLSN